MCTKEKEHPRIASHCGLGVVRAVESLGAVCLRMGWQWRLNLYSHSVAFASPRTTFDDLAFLLGKHAPYFILADRIIPICRRCLDELAAMYARPMYDYKPVRNGSDRVLSSSCLGLGTHCSEFAVGDKEE
jgi:hypothetical protein